MNEELAQEQLRQLLQEAPSSKELPSLLTEDEASQNALQQLFRNLSEILERWIVDWLKFNDLKINSADLWWVTWLGYGFVIFVLMIGILGFFFWIRSSVRPRPSSSTFGGVPVPSFQNPLADLLEEALSSRQFAKAARIRWKIWLKQSAKIPSATPAETLPALAPLADHLMFADDFGSESEFRNMEEQVGITPNRTEGGWTDSRVLIAVVAFFVFVTAAQLYLETVEKNDAAATKANGPLNISLFHRVRSTHPIRAPMIYPEQLKPGKSLLMMLSPKFDPSPREAQLIKDSVRSGSTLLLSFHEEKSLKIVERVLRQLDIKLPSARLDPTFVDRMPKTIVADQNQDYFRAGEEYVVYSRYIFSEADCAEKPLSCYSSAAKIGEGQVIVWAGIPLISEALIGRADNKKMASRIMAEDKEILVDEYHLFFSDVSGWDLFGESFFILPALGLLLGLVGYYLFSGREHKVSASVRRLAEPFHQFGRRFFFATAKKFSLEQDGFAFAKERLRFLFRGREDALFEIEQAKSLGELISVHHKFMKLRGLMSDSTGGK